MKRRWTVPVAAAAFVALSSALSLSSATAQEKDAVTQLRQIIEAAKDKVYPALVFIKPIQQEYESGEKRRREVLGSGVIISPDGLVVTNYHVVEHAVEIHCVLSDKRQLPVKLLGQDPETDLALLQLEGLGSNEQLPYAEFADSDQVQAGDFVMAMGSPFGFERSISWGILSNTRRYMGFESQYIYNTFLQTDAAINPGNSGGPLVNIEGKVVGINTLGVRGGEGLGFAIPSNVVKEIVARLRREGRVVRAYTGLKLQPLRDFRSNTFVEGNRGVLVRNVELDSPAEKSGIKAGDLLIKVNDQTVTALYIEDLPQVERLLADLPVGQPARLALVRSESELEVSLVPVLKGSLDLAYFECKKWDFTAREYNEFSEPTLAFYRRRGVHVTGVREPGNALRAGLQERDILLEIDGKPIETIEDLSTAYQEAISRKEGPKRVLIKVQRAQLQLPIVLDFRRDYGDD
jgi:serine protease Do